MRIRRSIIAANWKMHKTVSESETLIADLILELSDISHLDVVVFPPFTALFRVADLVSKTNIRVGAQDMYWEKEGPYTGEISATMLRGVYCRYVIIGHSERRQYFYETNATVNLKAKAALAANLRPIICVGETLEERENHDFKLVVQTQLQQCLEGISADSTDEIVIAYEPIWAIGTGRNATPEQAQEVHAMIRSTLGKLFGVKHAKMIRIQYGGSVKPDNAAELLAQNDIDGALVGGASLDARSFSAIVRAIKE